MNARLGDDIMDRMHPLASIMLAPCRCSALTDLLPWQGGMYHAAASSAMDRHKQSTSCADAHGEGDP